MRIEKYLSKRKWKAVSGWLWWKKIHYVSRNKKAVERYISIHK